MNKVERKTIVKTINREYIEARQWCRIGYLHTFCLMIDVSDARIWTDLFLDENSYKIYHSETIHHLSPGTHYQTVEERIENMVKEAIQLLEESGWCII